MNVDKDEIKQVAQPMKEHFFNALIQPEGKKTAYFKIDKAI